MDRLFGSAVALGRIGVSRGLAAATRISIMALCGAFAAVAAASAIGCLVAALWVVALPSLGPAEAALAAAGALGLISLILIALIFVIGRRGRRRAGVNPETQAVLIEVTRLLKESKGAMLLGALIAGLAAGSAHRN